MANQPNEGFSDNWAYLKTELGWLDRMLMMALSRYRQDKKGTDRIAQTKADKVSSHWWKGVISLEGKIAYDEHRPNAKIHQTKATDSSQSTTSSTSSKSKKVTVSRTNLGYQKQLEARLKISRKNGVILALPWFCDRLQLSLFEKNLMLMALAPEVNRRYTRLYRYLQSQDESPVTDLPTVELVLRLLCRNDVEWRRARTAFQPSAPLIRHGLLMTLSDVQDPLLGASLRLTDECVDCLLAETPDPALMERLIVADGNLDDKAPWTLPGTLPINFSNELSMSDASGPGFSPNATHATLQDAVNKHPSTHDDALSLESGALAQSESVSSPNWEDLVVSPSLKDALRHLSHRITFQSHIEQRWGTQSSPRQQTISGAVALFAGAPGTGKTLAARILAHEVNTTVHCVDLAAVMDIDYFQLLDELESPSHPVLMIQSAEHWLSRNTTVPASRLNHFLAQRRKSSKLTILSVNQLESVASTWDNYLDQTFAFALPTAATRCQFWQNAFPPKTKFSRILDWSIVSHLELSGGDIVAIAHDAMVRMLADGSASIKLEHLVAALQWHKIPDPMIEKVIEDCHASRKRTLMEQKAKATTKQAKSKSKVEKKRSRKAKSHTSKPTAATTHDSSLADTSETAENAQNNASTAPSKDVTIQQPTDSVVQTPTP